MRNYYLWIAAVAVAAGLVTWGAHQQSYRPPGPADGRAAPGGTALPEGVGEPLPEVRVVRDRLAAKGRVAEALLAGDCTLLEAAARFRELDAVEPRVRPEAHPDVYAGDTEAERYCRAVIVWAENFTQHPRGQEVEAGVAVRRLEDELEGRRRYGMLELPRPPGDTEGVPCPHSP